MSLPKLRFDFLLLPPVTDQPVAQFVINHIPEKERIVAKQMPETESMSRADWLTKANIADIYPLSPTQEGMLFHALVDTDAATYFQQSAYRLMAKLDVAEVEQALNELVLRHEALRTVFKYSGVELPLQIVLKNWKPDFYYEDLQSSIDPHAREDFVLRFKEQDRARTFDLSKDALLRVSLLRLTDDVYEFVWSCHHIVMDGWCLNVLRAEFFEIYSSLREQRPYRLPEARPYSLYIKWLQQRDKDASRRFWTAYLDGYDEVASFPRQKPLIIQPSEYRRDKVSVTFDKVKSDAIRALSGAHQVTPYQLLQTIWGVMLTKFTGRPDVVYGSVVASRPSEIEGVENIVGLFINTVPVRVRCETEERFSDLLANVKMGVLASEEHGYFPLNEIQELSSIKGSLFDHILVATKVPPAAQTHSNSSNGDNRVTRTEAFEQTNYNLCVDLIIDDEIGVSLTFNAHVHELAFIERTGAVFQHIVEQILAQPSIPANRITLLTTPDRELIERFNTTERAFPVHVSVAQLIEGFASTRADAEAIICRDSVLSYGELNARANRLAHYLHGMMPLEPDDRVAILLERSAAMVETILATWKAGGAYVPVDVAYPDDRIYTMIADAGARLIITDSDIIKPALRVKLSGTGARVVALNEIAEDLEGQSSENIEIRFNPNSLAYVIYTSGSTGQPKGAMVEHAGMLNHLHGKIHDLHLDEQCVIAQNASHCFDISVWQFFAALAAGGQTVIYDNDAVLQIDELFERLAADRVTVLEVVPSYLSTMLSVVEDTGVTSALEKLSHMIVTGEAVKPALVKRWFELFPGIPLLNAYGPTEASDDITHHIMTEAASLETVPIGRPLQNLKIYIADEYMNLCPVGIKGEILVSGIGVGRGYLNDAEKTGKAFTNDPFRPEAGVRLYKTGDIGRYLESGLIEFFGRRDTQVKVRGYRIELEEIENVIMMHRAVREVVVLDKCNAGGDTYLSCYIVAGEGFDLESLQTFLAEKLPEFLIPAFFTQLDRLPLNANGKLDRKELRVLYPANEIVESAVDYVAPRNEIEEKLAKTWQAVLGVERVGIKDNFFDSGGDSFKAIRVVSKFGRGFLVPDIYKYQTIEELARFIGQNNRAADSFLYELTPLIEQQKYAIVAVPNSAGDPLIYRDTTAALMQLSDEYALYGVHLPRIEPGPDESMASMMHSLANSIVDEIKNKIDVPIILYGQCNGAALALQIAKLIEDENLPCKAICLGAQLPMMRVTAEEDTRTDQEILDFLDTLDANYPDSLEDQLIFIRNFRYDGILARASYNTFMRAMQAKEFSRFRTPLFSVVGDKDPLTKNYKTRVKDWSSFAEQTALIEVKDVGHYIWRENPTELASILYRIGEGTIEATETAKSEGLFARVGALFGGR